MSLFAVQFEQLSLRCVFKSLHASLVSPVSTARTLTNLCIRFLPIHPHPSLHLHPTHPLPPPSSSLHSTTPFLLQAKKGGFKDTCPEDLLVAVFTEAIKRAKVSPKDIGDIAVGNVLPPGGGANVARMAMLAAGIPHT